MHQFEWFNVMEKSFGNTFALVQTCYIQSYERQGKEIGLCFKETNHCKLTLQTSVDGQVIRKTRFFPKILFDHREAFLIRLDSWLRNFDKYMERKLALDDFQRLVIDKETQNGYYSFHSASGYEICLDGDDIEWTVFLCNKFEEVVEEHKTKNVDEALKKANEIYWSFAPM